MIGTEFLPTMGILTSRPPGIGRVFFVDHFSGLNTNNGIDPGTPFQTITHALTLCVSGHNDYIIVLDAWDDEPAYPISVVVDRVHIIGVSMEAGYYVKMNSGVANDQPVFQIGDGSTGQYVEIAGFSLAGGALHGCIDCNQARGLWLHHCWFGHDEAGAAMTPRDGVALIDGNTEGALIENCRFFGTAGAGPVAGVISGDGVSNRNYPGISNFDYSIIRNCIFQGLAFGIWLDLAVGAQITSNFFAVGVDAAVGEAITLFAPGNPCLGCIISDNRAGHDDVAIGFNPYRDIGTPGTNCWTMNYDGLVAVIPAA